VTPDVRFEVPDGYWENRSEHPRLGDLFRELVDERGFDSHVVKRSFGRLGADGTGEQEQPHADDVGLTLYAQRSYCRL